MVGWHHLLSGQEFEYTLGVGDGQRSLAGYSPLDHKELDVTKATDFLGSMFKHRFSGTATCLW